MCRRAGVVCRDAQGIGWRAVTLIPAARDAVAQPLRYLLLPSPLPGAQALSTSCRRSWAGGLPPAVLPGQSSLGACHARVRGGGRQAGRTGRGGSTGRSRCVTDHRAVTGRQGRTRAMQRGSWGRCRVGRELGGCRPGTWTHGPNEVEVGSTG